MGRLILFYVVPLVLTIYCLVSAITSRDEDVRHLPKVGWILLILFFPILGSIAWLAAGRAPRPRLSPGERAVPHFPEYDRPGRAAGGVADADDQFLAQVRERAEQQRRRYEAEQRRKREQEEAELRERRERRERRESGGSATGDVSPEGEEPVD